MNKKVWIFWIVVFTVFAVLMYLLRGILLPFVLSFILAYILNPLVLKLEKRGLSRTIASLTVVMLTCLAILSTLLVLIPVIEVQIVSFVSKIPSYAGSVWNKIQPIIEQMKGRISLEQIESFKESLSTQASEVLNSIGRILLGLFSQGMILIDAMMLIVITPVVTFYLLSDWHKLVEKIKALIPRQKQTLISEKLNEMDAILSASIRGQAIVCLFLGLFYGTGLSIVGLDLGFVVGFISGILSFIPYVGSLMGFFLSLLLAFTQGANWMLFMGILAVFGVGQFLEGNILTPKLVGSKVGLHPAWVIFILMSFGSLFGFMGVLLAVPVGAMVGVLVRSMVAAYQKSSFYKGGK